MTSDSKRAANKRNASLSTGPRTEGGKVRSSQNAICHGLASPIANDPSAAAAIERLAAVLSSNANDYWRREEAQLVAERYFVLARIRAARTEVLLKIGDIENGPDLEVSQAVAALEKIARYEQRTRSRVRRKLMGKFEP